MKIIIVGAGISGIANYLWLKKLLPDSISRNITILEACHEPDNPGQDASASKKPGGASHIGGGLGIGPNGLRTLKTLDADLYHAVKQCGYPVHRHQLKSSRGATLGAANASFKGECTLMAMRQDVWEALRAKLPAGVVRWNSKITGVKTSADGRIEAHFEDGSIEVGDILIGADGLRSQVRTYVVGEQYPTHYEGLVGVGGLHSSSSLPSLPADGVIKFPNSPSVMTFGAQGFVGYAPASQALETAQENGIEKDPDRLPPYGPKAMWWSTYEFKEDPGSTKIDVDAVRSQLIGRHGTWADEHIVDFITNGGIVGLWPTYIVENLPKYHKNRVVLTGDAAHAMPSTSGQGSSQAMEDAQALALLLAHYLPKDMEYADSTTSASQQAIETAFTKFTALRKPRTDQISNFARKMGDHKRKKGFVEEWITYGAVWLFTKVPSSKREEALYGYDVEKAVQDIIESK